jgi:hypothetical protein
VSMAVLTVARMEGGLSCRTQVESISVGIETRFIQTSRHRSGRQRRQDEAPGVPGFTVPAAVSS